MNNKGILPKISIVTPSYNQGEFLEETINSILDQKYPNLEYVLIDGGSTDNSLEIINRYSKHFAFWISEPDGGQAHAINKGFAKCTGDILTWTNSDDILLKNSLEVVSNYNWSNNIGAIVGIGRKINKKGKILYTPYVKELNTNAFFRWVGYGNFMQPACFFSKQAWETCGPLREDLHFCFDVDLWLKISKKYSFEKIDKEIAHAYIHKRAKTTAETEKMKIETALLIAQHGGFLESRNFLYEEFATYFKVKKTLNLLTQNSFYRFYSLLKSKFIK